MCTHIDADTNTDTGADTDTHRHRQQLCKEQDGYLQTHLRYNCC